MREPGLSRLGRAPLFALLGLRLAYCGGAADVTGSSPDVYGLSFSSRIQMLR
jgi:hypothetical protein